MNHYKIFRPYQAGSFADRIENIDKQICEWLREEETAGFKLAYSKTFLSDAQNQYQLFVESELYQNTLSHAPNTLIEQAPLDGAKVSILAKTSDTEDNSIFQSIRLTEEETRATNSYVADG